MTISALETGHTPLDWGVFGMNNSKTKTKEYPGSTMARTDMRPWRPTWARRDGTWSWSCVKEANTAKRGSSLFFCTSSRKPEALTSESSCRAPDLAHDALPTRVALAGQREVSYIIKWNPRKEDQLEWARRIFQEGTVITPGKGKRVGLLTVHIRQVHEGKTYNSKG